jgi:hypothetical protein
MITLPILLALAAGAADAVPAPERPNALAFDNGTVLVSDGGSYSPGIRSWSAWHLTDGDEGSGWCSPQGKPTGLAFVWELDTTWRLDTLAVSTRHLQEQGYPGISALKRGVKAERLQPKGFGRSKPVADNATAQGRALNRRVEVSILE